MNGFGIGIGAVAPRLFGPVVIAGLLLGACSSSPPRLPLSEASSRYAATVTSVTEALSKAHRVTWSVRDPETSFQGDQSKSCVYRSAVLASPTYLGTDVPWSTVKTTVDAALAGGGFGPTTVTEDNASGWLILTATDGHGATLTVRAKGGTEVRIDAPTAEPTCPSR